jgi:uncharacterized protein YcbK (DUF882 family)
MAANEGEVILLKRRKQTLSHTPHCPTRRRLLTVGAGALISAGSLVSGSAFAKSSSSPPERSLSIYNLHTDESLNTVYWADGEYIDESLSNINYLMRDFRNDEVKAIHPQLLNLLHAITDRLGTTKPIQLVSGYRSPATNAMLHARSNGVAKHSLHMDGMASDIRIPGHDLRELHKVAISLRGGGVGYYPQSDFVHVDVGRVRYWNGV